jgi:hypothetical protein
MADRTILRSCGGLVYWAKKEKTRYKKPHRLIEALLIEIQKLQEHINFNEITEAHLSNKLGTLESIINAHEEVQ